MPRGGFELPTFKNEIKKVYFLSDPEQTALPVNITNNLRVVQTPRNAPNPMANVLVAEISGDQVER